MRPSDQPLRHVGGPGETPPEQARADAAKPVVLEPEDPKATEPKDVKKVGEGTLEWTWGDGHVSTYALKFLRERCPCAQCVDEWTGKRTLDPNRVPADVRIRQFEPVGYYAIRFDWSDGHDSGLYSFRYLRGVCPCTACDALRARPSA